MALNAGVVSPSARGARPPTRQALARHDLADRRTRRPLTGKTLLIVGMGRIGGRLARLAKASTCV
jgi:phosphoglycerate dehydrogenase-like enzyme